MPRTSATLPRPLAEWYFLLSNDFDASARIAGQVNTLNHAFTPVPFGNDLSAEFGDELALPIVGNFDPPVAGPAANEPTGPHIDDLATNPQLVLVGDFDGNGVVDRGDYNVWFGTFGSTTDLRADANQDGVVDLADYSVWKDNEGATTSATSASLSQAVTTVAPQSVSASFEVAYLELEDSPQAASALATDDRLSTATADAAEASFAALPPESRTTINSAGRAIVAQARDKLAEVTADEQALLLSLFEARNESRGTAATAKRLRGESLDVVRDQTEKLERSVRHDLFAAWEPQV